MSLKRLFLFAVFILGFLAAANSFSINNFDFKPSLCAKAVGSNNESALYNGEDYAFASLFIKAPAQYSFTDFPAAIYLEPYFKTYYSEAFEEENKLALANAFLLLNFGDYSLKLGRQYFYREGTNFALYFGPDDNFDFSFPSYIDGALFSFNNDFLSYDVLFGKAEEILGGFNVEIRPKPFWKISLFSYLKEMENNPDLYLFGAGSQLLLTSRIGVGAYFAFNAGKEYYKIFNSTFAKRYDGYFIGLNSEADLSSETLDAVLHLAWTLSSPSGKDSFAFTPLSPYNIYGLIAGGQELFSNGMQALSFGVNISPVVLERLNLDFEVFYYSSSFKDSFNQYIGSEINLSAAYAFDNFNLKLSYAYFYPDTGFLEDNAFSNYDINNYIHSFGLYLSIGNIF